MSEKNIVSSILESAAVEFGVDGAYEAIQKDGFLGATQKAVENKVDDIKQGVNDVKNKAKEVGGYLKEDFNNLKDAVGDLFASEEEKAAKKAEEEAKKAKEEAEKKAQEEEEKARREALDKSYILHTALLVCDKAYITSETGLEAHPSYIVLPQSHGESIHGLPQLNVDDYIGDVNVLNFGICRSPKNPSVQAAAREILDEVKEETKSWTDKLMSIFVDDSNNDVCDSEESLAAYCAGVCTPKFDKGWVDGKEDVLIDGSPALLGRCTLNCIYGGNITIQSSGQPE